MSILRTSEVVFERK